MDCALVHPSLRVHSLRTLRTRLCLALIIGALAGSCGGEVPADELDATSQAACVAAPAAGSVVGWAGHQR